jgi:hypothetical protein
MSDYTCPFCKDELDVDTDDGCMRDEESQTMECPQCDEEIEIVCSYMINYHATCVEHDFEPCKHVELLRAL